jgi:hypothetical protein
LDIEYKKLHISNAKSLWFDDIQELKPFI